jgi:hypothetical protein
VHTEGNCQVTDVPTLNQCEIMRDVIPTAYRYSLATAYIPDYFLHLASFRLLSPEGLVIIEKNMLPVTQEASAMVQYHGRR